MRERDSRDWRSSFLVEYDSDTVFPRIHQMGYVAARTERHKYIQYRELKGMDELYDLEADPFEETKHHRPSRRERHARADEVRAGSSARADEMIENVLPAAFSPSM